MGNRRVKKIDNLRWTSSSFFTSGLTAGSVAATWISTGTAPETIMRTRGSLLCALDGVAAPSVFIDVAIGLILVPEGTGTTVNPTVACSMTS